MVHGSLPKTLLGASLWGLSGTAAQALFQFYNFPVLGLVTIRMLVSGSILMLILRPGKPPRPWTRLVALSLIGYAGSGFFYLTAIQYSNAATATLLQFLFLPMIAGYEAFTGWFHWSQRWTVTIGLALVGTILLVVGESFQVLVTPLGLIAGLLAAFSGAYYTLGSRDYVRTHGSWWVTCWGFSIGGLATIPLGIYSLESYKFPTVPSQMLDLGLLIGFVIVFGTLLAFGLYVSGLKDLTATETGIVSSAEPIVSAVATFLFLGVVLTPTQYLGGATIILAVVLVATNRNRTAKEEERLLEKTATPQV